MEQLSDAKLLRIFIGELDKIHGRPLHEEITFTAKSNHLAGATVIRGIMSFGKNSRIHTAKLLDLSYDLPIIIEIVDTEKKINDFMPILNKLLDDANCGAAVVIEDVIALLFKTHK
jgi:PII-like signaling protein